MRLIAATGTSAALLRCDGKVAIQVLARMREFDDSTRGKLRLSETHVTETGRGRPTPLAAYAAPRHHPDGGTRAIDVYDTLLAQGPPNQGSAIQYHPPCMREVRELRELREVASAARQNERVVCAHTAGTPAALWHLIAAILLARRRD